MKYLDEAVEEAVHFFEEHSINYLRPVREGKKITIAFELSVKSFVAPGQLSDNFRFELILWERNGEICDEMITKKNTNVPFHPNFAVSTAWGLDLRYPRMPYGVWKGREPDETDIDLRLKRMILSLQFYRDYVKAGDKASIGSKSALNWYLKEHYANPSAFPTDRFLKPDFQAGPALSSAERKKFEVVSGETDAKKKFTINKETSFSPAIKPLQEPPVVETLNSLVDRKQSSSAIYISSLAKDQIFKHIQWGNTHAPESKFEQGGLLLGKVYYDQYKKIIHGIVEQGIPGESAYGTATHLEMSHQTWAEMIHKVDNVLKREEGKDLQIIGWYHTHPNHLDVFMSGTDLNTQKRYFNKDWHFAIVLNPQKCIWKAFSGADARECKGFVVSDGLNRPASVLAEADEHRMAPVQEAPPVSGYDEATRRTSASDDKSAKLFNKSTLFFALLLIVFAIWSRSGSRYPAKHADKKEKPATSQAAVAEPVTSATVTGANATQATNPIQEEPIKLKVGTILYNEKREQLFEKPLLQPMKVFSAPSSGGWSKIKVDVFAHREVVGFAPDSVLQIFGNVRSSKTTTGDSLVGKLIDTLLVQKNDYAKQGDWYKIKFTAVAKQ